MQKVVIVPTYNEFENIQVLLPRLMDMPNDFDVLVVDDSSPDGTAAFVKSFAEKNSRVHLLLRAQKNGLGKAYIAGFKWGLEHNYEALIEMDADFSHRPEDLAVLLTEIDRHEVVIGSRYVPGGQTVHWGLIRKIISRGGSLYSRLILGYPTRDWTGGFNAWHANVLRAIDLDTVQSNGYSFQIELKYKAQRKGFKVIEVPIIFEDRRVGQSKMSLKIVLEAFYKVWIIK